MHTQAPSNLTVRVGVPLPGGQLVRAARERGLPVLFSANAFARTYPKGHAREGEFKSFRFPDAEQFAGLDAALDSAGFVAASVYGDYRWDLESYMQLCASHPWSWFAAPDYCMEPQIASDRPLRILRIAATAFNLGRCRAIAARLGIANPTPTIQGWETREFIECAELLPLSQWPDLVAVGSVCRRHLHGANGLFEIVAALDKYLPPNTRMHLYGVKSQALDQLARHPRIASVDSMAWDTQARCERRTGRDMQFRIDHMEAWNARQLNRIAHAHPGAGLQSQLFDPATFGGFTDHEALVLEALAHQHAELVLDGDLEYRDAVHHVARDGVTAIAILRQNGFNDGSMAMLDELIAGVADKVAELLGD